MLLGVCSGIAEYLNTDPTIIRIVWIILTVLTGVIPGAIAYFLCALVIPEK